MQEHFGQSMNLARIKLMAMLLLALCVVQTVSLHKLADAMPTDVDKDSNLRRLQRFFAKYILDLVIIARMIFSLLPVKTGLVLSMDRTNRKFGNFNFNILMPGVTFRDIAKPSTGASAASASVTAHSTPLRIVHLKLRSGKSPGGTALG